MEPQGDIPVLSVSSEYPGYPRIPRHRVYGGATGGISRDCLYRPSIPGILGYQDTGYMVEPQGEYPGTVWYRPSIPGILGYQDTGYMVEPQGEYSGTVWYRPSIPGILAYQDTGYMVETQGGISRDCLVSSEYPIPYSGIPRHMEGDPGTDWYTVLVSRVYVVPKHNGDCASSLDIQGSTRTVLGSTGHVCKMTNIVTISTRGHRAFTGVGLSHTS